jgi:polysaccharide deacetylase 2 family uncharacterized protein YibQ
VRHAIWLAVIGFSISALAGGFFSGRAAMPHFPAVAPTALSVTGVPQTDDVAADDFANDEAVTLAGTGADIREDARLAIVLVDMGHSQALEARFFDLDIPVTVVIDPNGQAAEQMLQLAKAHGDHAYVQASVPLREQTVRGLHQAYPAAGGIAAHLVGSQVSQSALRALRESGLALLDEYGENALVRDKASSAGIRFAARGVTVDDHAQRTYVEYMLRQAVRLARGHRVVVMARPFPGTLQAFEALFAQASREGVRFVGL